MMTIGFAELHTPRPLSEWHEDIGDVLWWSFPIQEPPYIGTPFDLGQTVEVSMHDFNGKHIGHMNAEVGGWPGYHTHWTPLPDSKEVQSRFQLMNERNSEDA